MSPARARIAVMLVAAALTALLFALPGSRAQLVALEERVGALAWTLAPNTDTESRLVIVSIDERSLAEVGPWPWSRETLAELSSAITDAGAQLQLHDILYAEAKDGNQQLVAALNRAPGAVIAQIPVLDINQSPDLAPQTVRAGQLGGQLSGIDCTQQGLMSSTSFLAPHAGFAGVAKGHIAPVVNADGSITKQPAAVCIDGQVYPALALAALLEASNLGLAPDAAQRGGAQLRAGTSLFGAPQTLTLDAYPGLSVPLDAAGNLRLSYSRAPSGYIAVPAVDVLNGNADPQLFDNAWVLVGATAFGMGDVVPTPYSGATPGVELQARILGSVLDMAVPYTPSGAAGMLAALALVFAAVLLGAPTFQNGRYTSATLLALIFALPLLALALHAQLLRSENIWLGWMMPAVFALVAATSLIALEQVRTRSQRDRVFANLASYLPGDAAAEIAYTLPSSNINAQRQNVTLLSADLRNFSAFSEARTPEETAAVLHFFFQKATAIVEAHGGKLHEYKGDSILALWQAQDTQSANQALQAAQQLVAEIDAVSLQAKTPYGLEPLALGVSIEQGPALVGSIGPAHRRSHTLLGDTVTVTLRMQELTAELAQPILIGESAARQLDPALLQSQGSFLLDGLTIPHVLFALQPKQEEMPSLTQALQDHEAQDGQPQPKLRLLSGGRR
jgi:CHASE2 domain-containing sensor protein